MKRNRPYQFIFILITIAIGITLRKYSASLPSFIGNYAPDVFWSLAVFWTLGFFFPNRSTVFIAIFSLIFSFFIELTQLYHSPFIDAVRATGLGGLVLGYTFIWSDLLCYFLGVLVGVVAEKIIYS